jgi:hypothetical protein
VEKVLDHIDHTPSNAKRKPHLNSLEFLVRWLGYGADQDIWLPWKELRNNLLLHRYLHDKGLDSWIPKEHIRENYDISFDALEADVIVEEPWVPYWH